MRRSLGGGGSRGRGMGGGSGTIRALQRAVHAGVGGTPANTTPNITGAKTGIANKFNKKRPTSPNTSLTLFSPSFSSTAIPAAAASAPAWTDESEWEYVHRVEDEAATARGWYDNNVFGTVPSTDEVNHAVSALQHPNLISRAVVSSPKAKGADCEMEWVEPSHNFFSSSKVLQRPSTDVVSNAFHLLETEPSVQRMVVSLSSDQAVWDAVLNNEVVRELRGSIHRVASLVGESTSSSDPDGKGNILSWVVTFAKSKMMQLLDLITNLLNSVLGTEKKGDDDGLEGRVKSSFFLSIIVLLVVILARTKTTTNA